MIDLIPPILTAVSPIVLGVLMHMQQRRATRREEQTKELERQEAKRTSDINYWRDKFDRADEQKDALMIEAAGLRQQVIERDARITRLETLVNEQQRRLDQLSPRNATSVPGGRRHTDDTPQ